MYWFRGNDYIICALCAGLYLTTQTQTYRYVQDNPKKTPRKHANASNDVSARKSDISIPLECDVPLLGNDLGELLRNCLFQALFYRKEDVSSSVLPCIERA